MANKIIKQIDSIIEQIKNKNEFTAIFELKKRIQILIDNYFSKSKDKYTKYLNTISFSPYPITRKTTKKDLYKSFLWWKETLIKLLEDMKKELEIVWNIDWVITKKIKEKKFEIDNFWSIIHRKIIKVSKQLFENWHYDDAVFKAVKQIEIEIKNKTGIQDSSWKSLMFNVFNETNSKIIFKEDKLNNQTNKDIQEWYKFLFWGTMQAVKNPKSHDNIRIDKKRAIHLLFLVSLLMYKLDEWKIVWIS